MSNIVGLFPISLKYTIMIGDMRLMWKTHLTRCDTSLVVICKPQYLGYRSYAINQPPRTAVANIQRTYW